MDKRPEQTLFQGGHIEEPETYERMLSITTIRDMQIKTTLRYHFTLVRMSIINKSLNNKYGEDGEKRKSYCTGVGLQTGAATVENCMEFPQKTKNGTAFLSSNSTAETIP